MNATSPFPLTNIEPELEALRAHWASLIRGANNMPFWDDFAPSAVPQLAERLFALDVFDKPNRFRYSSIVGAELEERYGGSVRDMFVHTADKREPFDYLESQAEATVEAAEPTCYRASDYSRLLLPMWGDGRIGMLLGAVAWR